MDSLISGIFNLLGALMLCYLGSRLCCSSGASILSSLIGGEDRQTIRDRYSRFPFFQALTYAHFEQLPINVYVSILGYANSRAINLRQTVSALRGAMVGNSLFLWLVAFCLGGGVTFDFIPLQWASIFLVLALLFFNYTKTQRIWWFFIGCSLLILGCQGVNFAASDLMLSNSSVVLEFMVYTTQGGIFSIIMGALIGAFFSFLFRSPTMSVIVALLLSGLYDQNIFLYGMACGAPLGILFPLSGFAQRANATARRALLLHSLTVLGSVIFSLILCGIFYTTLNEYFIQLWVIVVIFTLTSLVFPSLVWMGIEPICSKMVGALIPYDNASHRLSVLSESVKMPPLFVVEIAKQEVVSHTRRTYKMLTILRELLNLASSDQSHSQRIDKYHSISQRVEIEIADYILQLDPHYSDSRVSKYVKLLMWQGHTLVEISSLIVRMRDILSRVELSGQTLSTSQVETLDGLLDDLQVTYSYVISQMNKRDTNESYPCDQIRTKIAGAGEKYYLYNQYPMIQLLEAVSQLLDRLLYLDSLEKDICNVNNRSDNYEY